MNRFIVLIITACLLACSQAILPKFCLNHMADNNVQVTLLIYSGTENPTWTLNSQQIRYFCYMVQETGYKLQNCMSSKLGYNGFMITIDKSYQFIINNNIQLEDFMFLSMPKHMLLPSQVHQHIKERQSQLVQAEYCSDEVITQDPAGCQGVVGPDTVPSFDPNNDDQGCFVSDQYDNNCYNYGNDVATGTFAQPGRGSGQKWSENTCEDIKASAERDGLVWIGQTLPSEQPTQGHYVALFIWPDTNFHWIRKDQSNFWSHKPGQTPVRDYDNNEQKITDPTQSDFSPWTQFCGYMQSIPSKVNIN